MGEMADMQIEQMLDDPMRFGLDRPFRGDRSVCDKKVKFQTEKSAKTQAANRALEVTLYVYKCPVCHYWHHTRRPQPSADDFDVVPE